MPLGDGWSAKWWTTLDQGNSFSTIQDVHQGLALPPEWRTRNTVSMMTIPKGTNITAYMGTAAKQVGETGNIFDGNAIQYRFKDFDPSWITSTRSIP